MAGAKGPGRALAVDEEQLVLGQLREKGHVTRGWIGVEIQPVTPAIADAIGLKNAEGALVTHLEPASPAARSGIETGDVITSVNAEAVKDSRDLAKKIAAIQPGTSARLTIFRYGQEKMITVTRAKSLGRPVNPKLRSKERGARNRSSD